MLSPLWSHSSHSKLLTIYLDVIIVCDIIKEENLRLCHLIISLEKLARGSGKVEMMGIVGGRGGGAISLFILFYFKQFACSMVVGAIQAGLSISEPADLLGFTHTDTFRVYR